MEGEPLIFRVATDGPAATQATRQYRMEASARRLYEQLHGDDAGLHRVTYPTVVRTWLTGNPFKLYTEVYAQLDGRPRTIDINRTALAVWLGFSTGQLDTALTKLADDGLVEKIKSTRGPGGCSVYKWLDARFVAAKKGIAPLDAQMTLFTFAEENDEPGVRGVLMIEDDPPELFDKNCPESCSENTTIPINGQSCSESCPENCPDFVTIIGAAGALKKIQTSLVKQVSVDRRSNDEPSRRADCDNVNHENTKPYSATSDEGEAAAPRDWWAAHHPELAQKWGTSGRYAASYRDAAAIESHYLRCANAQTIKTAKTALAETLRAAGDRAPRKAREALSQWAIDAVRDGDLPMVAINECVAWAINQGKPALFGKNFTKALFKKFYDIGRQWPAKAKGGDGQ